MASRYRRRLGLLAAGIVLIICANSVAQIWLNAWQGDFFDAIVRQPPIDEDRLDPRDNTEEFVPVSAEEVGHYAAEAERLFEGTDRALFCTFGGLTFGDIALVPGISLRHPKGIRDIEEWYVSTAARFDYVYEVFRRQCDIALANLAKIHAAVGDRVSAVFITGTDFGTQNGPFIGPAAYRPYGFTQPLFYAGAYWIEPRLNSHNNYVDLFSQLGIIGLLLFFWFMGELLWLGLRLRKYFKDDFASGYVNGMVGMWAGVMVIMALADWFLPFVYNIGFQGFQASVLVWMFFGGLLSLEEYIHQQHIQPVNVQPAGK